MIDPKLLRSDPEAVARNMARRGVSLDVEAFRALEDKRKPWQIEVDRLRSFSFSELGIYSSSPGVACQHR